MGSIPGEVSVRMKMCEIPRFQPTKLCARYPHVTPCTTRCVDGFSKEILSELDHGPTYVVRRLWDPGRPSYTSRSIFPIDLEILGQPKSYLDYIYQLASSSQPFLVILVLN